LSENRLKADWGGTGPKCPAGIFLKRAPPKAAPFPVSGHRKALSRQLLPTHQIISAIGTGRIAPFLEESCEPEETGPYADRRSPVQAAEFGLSILEGMNQWRFP
jgi:hypothetical protein